MTIKNVTVVGNLTRDFEPHIFASGKGIAKGGMASNDSRKNPDTGKWEDSDTTFLDLIVFESMLDNVVKSLSKGTRVVVTGNLRLKEWDKKNEAGELTGEKGYRLEMTVNEIAPSLRFAEATVVKVARSNGTAPESAPIGEEEEYKF